MIDKQWVKVEETEIQTKNYPWGILGLFIVLTIASFFLAVIVFFAYSTKYDSLATREKRMRENTTELRTSIEDYKKQESQMQTKIRELQSRLVESSNMVGVLQRQLSELLSENEKPIRPTEPDDQVAGQ